jgi:tRNA U54 and U55 pseudouridine synthase Pus10
MYQVVTLHLSRKSTRFEKYTKAIGGDSGRTRISYSELYGETSSEEDDIEAFDKKIINVREVQLVEDGL